MFSQSESFSMLIDVEALFNCSEHQRLWLISLFVVRSFLFASPILRRSFTLLILIFRVAFVSADKCGVDFPAGDYEDEEEDVTPAAKPRKTPKKQSTTKSEFLLSWDAKSRLSLQREETNIL